MERLSEKVDYMQQEQIEMESNQDAIRRDMEKLRTGKSLYVDIAREGEANSGEANSGEARERDVMTQLLDMLTSLMPLEQCSGPLLQLRIQLCSHQFLPWHHSLRRQIQLSLRNQTRPQPDGWYQMG